MSGIRKLFCFLGVVVAFALSGAAFAQVKNFSESASPSFVPPGSTNATETITFLNSASGNSLINSLSLAWQVPAGVTVTFVSADSGTLTNVSPSGFSIINMNGVKPGKTFTIKVAITVPGDAVCSAASSFTGKAWTGNTLGGTQFTPTSGSVAQVYVGCNGTLACETVIPDLNPILGQGQQSKLGRGQFDFNGTTTTDCTGNAVPYSLSFIMLGTQTFVFTEVSNNQHPTTEYVVSWNPVALTAWPNFQPTVSWAKFTTGPNAGQDAYIPAVACAGDDTTTATGTAAIMPMMPAAYGDPYDDGTNPARAKVCIAEQGWVLVNTGTDASPVWQIQYWDRVLDQSDVHVAGP
jgi:hypothetical protein